MKAIAAIVVLSASVVGCTPTDSRDTYTLYRNSLLGGARIHVATFDVAGEASTYNRGNCEMVVRYLTQQPEVPEGYYWCEQGRYRP